MFAVTMVETPTRIYKEVKDAPGDDLTAVQRVGDVLLHVLCRGVLADLVLHGEEEAEDLLVRETAGQGTCEHYHV